MRTRKYILILLLITLLLSITSCGKNSVDIEKFTIVCASSASNVVKDAAKSLGEQASVDISYSDESFEHEILIGYLKRSESIAAFSGLLYDDYKITYTDGKIVICGGSDSATAEAVRYFSQNMLNDGKADVCEYTYKHEYPVKSITISGKTVSSFNTISSASDNSYDTQINELSERLTVLTGYRREESALALNIMLKCDSTLAPDAFLIKVATGDITLSAASSYGLDAAIDYFLGQILTRDTTLNDGDEFTGTCDKAEHVYTSFEEARDSLGNTYYKLTQDKSLNVVYYGGSVTAGYGATDSETDSWRALCTSWLESTFPDADIRSYNSSIGGSGSMLGAFRCEHDVLALEPDLVFIEFSINDTYCQTDTDDIKLYRESIIRQIWDKYPTCDIVELYVTDQSSARESNNGYYDAALAARETAEYYKIPSIYMGAALCSNFDYTNNDEWSKYFIDIVHPTDDGYAVYFDVLREYLEDELIYDVDVYDELTVHDLPEKLSDIDFTPVFITADKLDIIENENWSLSDDVYWNTANPYLGYLYPTDDDNSLTIRFNGDHAALFAEYGADNRLIYSFDGENDRIQNQKGNHPLMLNFNADDAETSEHTLTLSVNIKDHSSLYKISALLIW